MSDEPQIAKQSENARQRFRLMRLVDVLRDTVQLQGVSPEVRVEDVRVEMTNATAALLAPLVEAERIVREIIYASDLCVGHRLCGHSMQPWEDARALLTRLDEEDNARTNQQGPAPR